MFYLVILVPSCLCRVTLAFSPIAEFAAPAPAPLPASSPGQAPAVNALPPWSLTGSAQQAATAAWKAGTYLDDVEGLVKQSRAFLPLIRARVAEARNAAEVAKENDEEATKIADETIQASARAAKVAAMQYYSDERAIEAETARRVAKARAADEAAHEVAVAKAVTAAALPYHSYLLRQQQAAFKIAKRVAALIGASEKLEEDVSRLKHSVRSGDLDEASAFQRTLEWTMLHNEALAMRRQAEGYQAQLPIDAVAAAHDAEQQAVSHAAYLAAHPRTDK